MVGDNGRHTGIGGSDVHHLEYTPPWGCRRRLVYEKRQVPADFPLESDIDVNRRLLRGHRLEALGVELYEDVTARKTVRLPERRSRTMPFLMVHADRRIVRHAWGPGILEQKVVNQWAFKKYQKDGLPPAYILQLQWGMGLWSHRWGSFSLFWPDGWRVLHFDVVADPVLFAQLRDSAVRAWREVEHGPLPDPLPTDDPRCPSCPWRATCWGPRLAALTGDAAAGTAAGEVPEVPELAPIVADYLEAKATAKQQDELVELIRARLEDVLDGREAAKTGAHTIYFKKQADGVMLDEKTLKTMGKPKFVEWIYRRFGKLRRGAQPLRIV